MYIILVVSGVTLVTFYVVHRMHRRTIDDHLRDDARVISEVVENTILSVMCSGERSILSSMLHDLAKLHHVQSIQIMEHDGQLVFSPDPADSTSRQASAALKTFLQSSALVNNSQFLEGTHTTFRKWRKLPNEPPCQECHGADHPIRGVLQVATTDDTSLGFWQLNNLQHVILALTLILFLSGTTVGLFVHSIDRPVQIFQNALHRIEDGDFSVRIKNVWHTEMGQLAFGINSMAEKLEHVRAQLLEHHNNELTQAEALAKMGELAASMAHEIKNPISGIVFAVNSILRESSDGKREIFKEIAKQANRAEQNLEALLQFAKTSRLEPMPTDINAAVERILLFVRQQAGMNKIEIERFLDTKLPTVTLDPAQFEQVLLNLIINAIQAMPGGGNLKVCTAYMEAARRARVSVCDTGKGIPADIQERIFEPFYSTKSNGTGLGLLLCREVMTRHDGHLTFQTVAGQGTTFNIELPIENSFGSPTKSREQA